MAAAFPDMEMEEEVADSWEDHYNGPPDIPQTQQQKAEDPLDSLEANMAKEEIPPVDDNVSSSESEDYDLEHVHSNIGEVCLDNSDNEDDVSGLIRTPEDIQEQVEKDCLLYDTVLCGLSMGDIKNMLRLQYVISNINLQQQNLVDLLSDEQVFWIDGDSLLAFLHEQPTTDWDNQGQFLYLIFMAEKYIQLFVSRGGKPELVFFRDGEMIWQSMQPAVSLARKILVQHFTRNSSIHVYTEFKNCWDANWHEHLRARFPSFMLVSEGDDYEATSELGFYLNSLAMACQFHNLAVTSISSVISAGAKLISLTAVPSQPIILLTKDVKIPEKALQDILIKTRDKSAKNWANRMTAYVLPCQEEDLVKFLEDYQTSGVYIINDWRSFLSIYASVRYLKCLHVEQKQDELRAHMDIVRVFILHSVLLKLLPLSHRALRLHSVKEHLKELSPHGRVVLSKCQTVNTKDQSSAGLPDIEAAKGQAEVSDPVESFMSHIQLIMCDILDTTNKSMRSLGDLNPSSLADLLDGRLFYQLCLIYLAQKAKEEKEPELSDEIKEEYAQCWLIVKKMSGLQEEQGTKSEEGTVICCPVHTNDPSVCILDYSKDPDVQEVPLLPIDHPLVNEFTKDIKSRMVTQSRAEAEKFKLNHQAEEFDELYHWHSLKPLTDEYVRTEENQSLCKKPTTTNPFELRRITRSVQKYRIYMQRYGESLEGGSLTPYVISSKKDKKPKKGQKPKKDIKTGSKKEDIIKVNMGKIAQKKLKAETVKWKALKKEVTPLIETNRWYLAFHKMEDFMKQCTIEKLKLDILMEIVKQCFHAWSEICKHQVAPACKPLVEPIGIMLFCQKIFTNYLELTTNEMKDSLSDILSKLGFYDVAQLFNPNAKKIESSPLSVGIRTQQFQLEFMSHLLERDFPATPDPRVSGFIPDDWQRELLDAVDEKESALIVAPTSSGKTYASYYCIEQVLRDDDEGVVVYVAPTKALVNQVAATVYARFSGKKMPAGRAVFGLFTRDYRQDALNSQVLVTVPQCLEILLLSPHQQDWVSKLRYVIFDEVHCMGGEIGAEVWEHLILMIPCPFLALSATIANPHDLHRWMQGAKTFAYELHCKRTEGVKGRKQMARSSKVHLVIYNERYADLQKHVFLPESLAGDSTADNIFLPMHPFAVLDLTRLKEKGRFPEDLSLSPRESLQLYNAMRTVDKTNSHLQDLRPEVFFKEEVFIKRSRVREYEARMKEILLGLLSVEGGQEKVKEIKKHVGSGFSGVYNQYLRRWQGSYNCLPDGDKFGADTFVMLMRSLQAKNMLPALVFCYDLALCEVLAEKGCNFFIEKDNKFNDTEEKQNEIKSAIKQMEKLNKKTKKSRDTKKRNRDEDADHEDLKVSGPNVTIMRTRLTPPHFRLSYQELKDALRQVQDLQLCHCLVRGLGYHHAGVDAKGRGAVETLFRKKHAQLVTATGTLALGIHMPCKTVVIFSDSPYVTPLQFRQMSGRAGRRGYDLKGNVVFFGTRYAKIHQLINASMPDLKGNFPISVSLVLRLLLYVTKAEKYPEDALISARTLLEHTFFCHDKPNHLHQVKHHFLFSVQFLQQLGLVNFKGKPLQMTGLATHLHYHEPANFVFIQFLQKGLFHNLLKQEKRDSCGRFSEEVMRKLVLVLCHLFTKRRATSKMKKVSGYSGTLFLQSLPKQFLRAQESYNKTVRSIFGRYLSFVARYVQDEFNGDNSLPISKLEFVAGSTSPAEGNLMSPSKLTDKLLRLSLSNTACSPFVSNTGMSDKDLLKTDNIHMLVQSQVYADLNVIPVLDVIRDMAGKEVKLNAYAYDFFKHGSIKLIFRENHLLNGDVYNLLHDFAITLKSISTSLKEMVPDAADDLVVTAFTQLAEDYQTKFSTAFPSFHTFSKKT